jgi:hypothetical protein
LFPRVKNKPLLDSFLVFISPSQTGKVDESISSRSLKALDVIRNPSHYHYFISIFGKNLGPAYPLTWIYWISIFSP